MKKTVNVNISGRAFIIDENAYILLDNYLKNLRYYFRKEVGVNEIVADFETRIEELLSEKLRSGSEIINKEHIEEVIARVGKPGEFAEDVYSNDDVLSSEQETKRKLFRNPDNKLLGGVFAGLGVFFGCDITLLRIIGVLLLFITHLVIVPIYLVMWLIIPEANTAAEKLQMQGKPITVENIGKTVSQESGHINNNNRSFIDGLLQAFVIILKIFAIGIGILIGLPLLFVIFIVITVLFAVIFGVGGLLSALPFGIGECLSFITIQHPVIASITLIIVFGLPLIALIYTIIAHFAKFKPIDTSVKWILFGIWILSFVLLFFSGLKFENSISKHHKSFFLFPFINVDWNETVSQYETSSQSEIEYVIDDYFDAIKLNDMIASLEIKQISEGPSIMRISGDSKLVKQLSYNIFNQKLIVNGGKKITEWRNNNVKISNYKITILTRSINSLEYNGVGEVLFPNALYADSLYILQNSASKLDADSLYIKYLKVHANGVGSVFIAGQAVSCDLMMEGIGILNASELVVDSVKACVEGIGSLSCFPINYLNATVNGIGKISYYNEPNFKSLLKVGFGSITKEN